MSQTICERDILDALKKPEYQPLKPKALARRLNIGDEDYAVFRSVIKDLQRQGKIEMGKKHTVRLASRHGQVQGRFRPKRGGGGFVRPSPGQGEPLGEIFIPAIHARDASTDDIVEVSVTRPAKPPHRSAQGRVTRVVERYSAHYVGTYRERRGEGFIRADGNRFLEDLYAENAYVKGAQPGDKVVFEVVRYPSQTFVGSAVITEVLGQSGEGDTDLQSILIEFKLPDAFTEDALQQARQVAAAYDKAELASTDRDDFTNLLTITIDPVDAKDHDDAIHLHRDDKGHWQLGVHIADVSAFVPLGSPIDREAYRRGNSTYLPGKVIPMLPEILSNGLCSLKTGEARLAKSVLIDFDPQGRITHVDFHRSRILVDHGLNYQQVMDFYDDPENHSLAQEKSLADMLLEMRTLANILRERRTKNGRLEMSMPDPVLTLDSKQRVTDIAYAPDDDSHHVIEEFMVTANEAVAQELHRRGIPFLRRIHELPDPAKLDDFTKFAKSLDLDVPRGADRFQLQTLLQQVRGTPQQQAVNFALLRSLKRAIYSPDEEGHFGLASEHYCHFTSPIRRYPDLVVHRLLDRVILKGRAKSDVHQLRHDGDHCSTTERMAEKAERELTKLKVLHYLQDHIGDELEMTISGVEEYGFYVQGLHQPVEGLVHIRTLEDYVYDHDRVLHQLVGRHSGKVFRLGDLVKCQIAQIDLMSRSVAFTLAGADLGTARFSHSKRLDRQARSKTSRGPKRRARTKKRRR